MSIERGAQFQQDPLPGMERSDSRVRRPAKKLSRVPEGSQLSMLMPKTGLVKALDENKFRNTFETGGAGIGMGSLAYMSNRRAGEHQVFGIPEDAPGEQRPVYGFLRETGDIEDSWREKTTPSVPHHMRELRPYGNALVDIRPPKQGENVTTTESDSLNNPSSVNAEQLHHGMNPGGERGASRGDYTEVQWHDRPQPRSDIQGVHFMTDLGHPPHAVDYDSPDFHDVLKTRAGQVEQDARDLRLSGLRAPVHHWQEKAVWQPSLFNHENVGLQWEDAYKWQEGKGSSYWTRRQV